LEKIREILIEIIDNNKFIREFVTFIININKEYEDGIYLSIEENDYKNNNDKEDNENHNDNNYNNKINNPLSNILFKWKISDEYLLINNLLFFRILEFILKLINDAYGDPKENEIKYFQEFLPKEKIFQILKNKYIEVRLRIEILKFLSKFYIEFRIDPKKYNYYIHAISNSNLNSFSSFSSKNNYNYDLYSFLYNVDNISKNELFSNNYDKVLNDIFKLEIKNALDIIESEKKKKNEEILIYL
jgi:hypothetical protein